MFAKTTENATSDDYVTKRLKIKPGGNPFELYNPYELFFLMVYMQYLCLILLYNVHELDNWAININLQSITDLTTIHHSNAMNEIQSTNTSIYKVKWILYLKNSNIKITT